VHSPQSLKIIDSIDKIPEPTEAFAVEVYQKPGQMNNTASSISASNASDAAILPSGIMMSGNDLAVPGCYWS